MLLMVGIVCGLFGACTGIALGAMATKLKAYTLAEAKVTAISNMMSKLILANTSSLNAMVNALAMQGKVVETLRKEKKILQKQLDVSTEVISDLEASIEEVEGDEGFPEGNDSSDSEKPHVVVKATKCGKESVNKTVRNTVATDKLITLKSLLMDASEKGESVSPETLLGIVDFKME
jgi:hypothetical protein